MMLLDHDEAAHKTGLIMIQVCAHKLAPALMHTGKGAIDDINTVSSYIFWEDLS